MEKELIWKFNRCYGNKWLGRRLKLLTNTGKSMLGVMRYKVGIEDDWG